MKKYTNDELDSALALIEMSIGKTWKTPNDILFRLNSVKLLTYYFINSKNFLEQTAQDLAVAIESCHYDTSFSKNDYEDISKLQKKIEFILKEYKLENN